MILKAGTEAFITSFTPDKHQTPTTIRVIVENDYDTNRNPFVPCIREDNSRTMVHMTHFIRTGDDRAHDTDDDGQGGNEE